MAIRVPINPQTSVARGQLGYERPADISSGTRALGEAVRGYGEYVQQENQKKQLFDVQRMLVDEANALQTDFEAKKQEEPLGADGFTKRVNDDYEIRHQALVEGLRKRGFSEDSLNEFGARLGTMRGNFVAKAIDFQDKSQYTKVLGEVEHMATGISQYVGANPDALQTGIDEFKEGLAASGLDSVEQAAIVQHYEPQFRRSAQEGFTVQHPEIILEMYGLPNELKTVTHEATGELVNLGDAQQTVATEFNNAGWNNNVIAGFLGNFHIEGGYTGAKGDGGNAAGIAQWNKKYSPDRVANFKRIIGKPIEKASIAEQAKFAVWEMQNPEQAGMTIAQRDAILAAKSPEEAAELIDKYYERSDGKAREQRKKAAKLFTNTMAHADQTTQELVAVPTSGIKVDENGKTGIAVLDSASGPERIDMLNRARVLMNEKVADQKAAEREAHSAYINDFYNDLQDGTKGQADLDRAYETGLITDYDERQKAQGIIDSKIKKNTDLQRFGLMLNSGVKGNPYDKDQQKAVDEGFDKALEWDQKVGRQTSPFLIGLTIWQKTGVVPTQFGTMLRGGLIGTDPNTVAATASVATNMLDENPNAFAGVDGGEDIGKAAETYRHYVDDLGMTAQDAANKVAQLNSPEFKAKIKIDEKEEKEFIKKMKSGDIETRLNNELGLSSSRTIRLFTGRGIGGEFARREQLAEANQTFAELALSHWRDHHDEGAAISYATRQMGRFYGVEGGRLLKYPATKAYPKINGSREYIFDQAAEDISEYVGFEVKKEDIWLQPTGNGSSAAAFRAGKPVPYELHYVTHQDGQEIYHVVPGKTFVADVDRARGQAAVEARKEEQRVRSSKPKSGESYEQFQKRTKYKPSEDKSSIFTDVISSLFE